MKAAVVALGIFIGLCLIPPTQAQVGGTAADLPKPAPVQSIGGTVSRSAFTHAVVQREPTDAFEQITNKDHFIYYFTELKGMTGQTVTHRWIYKGETMAEVKFDVGAPRWRVWSTKTLLSEWTGTWTVQVLNGLGDVVFEESFEYLPDNADTTQ